MRYKSRNRKNRLPKQQLREYSINNDKVPLEALREVAANPFSVVVLTDVDREALGRYFRSMSAVTMTGKDIKDFQFYTQLKLREKESHEILFLGLNK